MDQPSATPADDADWPRNYFNYFTEIEEHFQRTRGTSLFLLSPLDWALIDNWKTAGIPLEAVVKGIDDAFEKWRSRKSKRRLINSLAYCAQAVLEAAQRVPAQSAPVAAASQQPFSADELATHLKTTAAALLKKPEPAFRAIGETLQSLAANAAEYTGKLEDLEQRLTALEEKALAAARMTQSDEDMLAIRQTLAAELKPYRGKMTAEQLAMLERRYIDTALLERVNLPRFSLFYLH